jgi:proton-dependent oligopeptide transporter, POT family
MFKGHPKGLYVAFFSNMGERFGFYTMVAIFVLFMQAKYGMSAATAGFVYSTFMVCVYFFPLLGGLLADKVLGFGKTISLGLIVMFLGYVLLAIPSQMNTGLPLIIVAMAVIAIGTGLFKGNLQALVGNLYDDPKYDALRDRAFTIFYMGINIGAMFAPSASEIISNWVLKGAHLTYDARIPALANSFLKGTVTDTVNYLGIAQAQDAGVTMGTLKAFSERYINALSKSYHFGFGVACLSLIFSMIIFWAFRKHYKHADITEMQKAKSETLKSQVVELTPRQTKDRLVALGLVFFVVIFFWMAFQQSGLTMTFFARDYTQHSVSALSYIWFDMLCLLAVFLALTGLVLAVKKTSAKSTRLGGAIAFVVFGFLAILRYTTYSTTNEFQPQRFQHFNPFFIVFMTPVVVGFFGWLNKRKKEPSAPRKIGFGMLITAVSFAVLVIGSRGLPSPRALGGLVAPAESQVSVYWLIWTYFIITIAELFLSPIGISYVSKVAPPKYKGLAQGAWFAATAAGLYLMGLVGGLWMKMELSALWLILVVACILSAGFMFAIMKKLERASGQ